MRRPDSVQGYLTSDGQFFNNSREADGHQWDINSESRDKAQNALTSAVNRLRLVSGWEPQMIVDWLWTHADVLGPALSEAAQAKADASIN